MRIRSLDAARGIAALVVVLTHLLAALPGGLEDRPALLAHGFGARFGWLFLSPLRLAFAGASAVVVFFVLSGLVLAMTFTGRDEHYGPYAVKRIARIWVPFAVTIVFSAAGALAMADRRVPGLSPWFWSTWGEPVTPHLLASHLFMTGKKGSLDGPMWSLVHEMRMSLVFPLLVAATRASWKTTLAVSAAGSVAIAVLRPHVHIGGPVDSLLQTAGYAYLFVLGIAIAFHTKRIRAALEASGRAVRAWLWVATALCLMISPSQTTEIATLADALLLIVGGCGAFLLLLLCLADAGAIAILDTPVPLFLGRISYSLYLTHMVTIAAVVRLVGPLPPLAGLAIAGAAAIGVAIVFQRYVEAPSARLGRWAAERLGKRRGVAAMGGTGTGTGVAVATPSPRASR